MKLYQTEIRKLFNEYIIYSKYKLYKYKVFTYDLLNLYN